jgi:hypothetical protein
VPAATTAEVAEYVMSAIVNDEAFFTFQFAPHESIGVEIDPIMVSILDARK